MYYIYGSVQAIPTYRVYPLHDTCCDSPLNTRYLSVRDANGCYSASTKHVPSIAGQLTFVPLPPTVATPTRAIPIQAWQWHLCLHDHSVHTALPFWPIRCIRTQTLSEKYYSNIQSVSKHTCKGGVSYTHVVFDNLGSMVEKAKEVEQQRRDKNAQSVRHECIAINIDTSTPTKWRQFLSCWH